MKRTVLLAAVFLTLAVCNSHAEDFWSQHTARELLADIFDRIEARGPEDALVEELEKFAEAYPRAAVTDEALSRLADIHLAKKDFRKAGSYYQKILERFPGGRYRIDALYGLGYSQYRGGRMLEAEEALRSVVTSAGSTMTMKVKARRLLATIAAITSSPWTEPPEFAIGAVLPLKGVYASFGEAALKGILLAADIFGEGGEGGSYARVEVKAIDTFGGGDGGRGGSAEDKIAALTGYQRIMGLLGPLASKTAASVARTAQEERIPIIVLSQREGVADTGDYVFRNFMTPNRQAESIALYAYEMLEKRKFAVLYPENRYGAELAKHFKKEIEALGGIVVDSMSYSPGQKDFAEELEFLFGIEVEEVVKGRRHIREYTSTVEIDALYIPDYPEAVGQIAPYLAFYNIKDVQLLGSNAWNSPKLLKLAGEYLEGAVFVDGFFPASERPGAKKFTESFKKTYGHPPGVIEAQAYDAALMLLSAVTEGGGSREGVREMLEDYYVFEGATGLMRFDEQGDTVKELFLLTVERNRIIEIL